MTRSKLLFGGKYGEKFAECAAPQAIRAYLNDAHRRDMAIHRELRWLEQVLAEREQQVAAGTWPPSVPPPDPGGTP